MTDEHRPHRARVPVRSSDLDTNGHVRGPAYLEYADHARWEWLRSAGVDLDALHAEGLGPVSLETTIRFRSELRAGDEVEVTSRFSWGGGRTSRVVQELHRPDGTLAAEITGVGGMLDLRERRLVADPRSHWRRLAARPDLLGL